jgi:hypothetical protein
MKKTLLGLLFALLVTASFSQNLHIGYPSRSYSLEANAEIGYLAVLTHRIQLGENGTYFNYAKDGGQNVLFPVTRYSLDLKLNSRSTLTFLYQPLRLETTEILRKSIMIDDQLFPSGTPMLFVYNFPFYRLSYLYDFAEGEDELAIGLSLQLRNATITFQSLDGELFRTQNDVGPVPILKFRARKNYYSGFWMGTEIDGFYAPISYINGSDTEVEGAILDASIRAGIELPQNSEAFMNLRYLGGGAVGDSEDERNFGDGYVKNWLQFLTLSVGFTYEFAN